MAKRRWNPPSKQLVDYRFVYGDPEGTEGTPAQKILRQMLAKDAGRFMDRLERLEKENREAREAAKDKWKREELEKVARKEAAADAGEEALTEDEGQERCLVMIDRLLREWRDELEPGKDSANA